MRIFYLLRDGAHTTAMAPSVSQIPTTHSHMVIFLWMLHIQITYALKLKLKNLPGYSITSITHSAISFWFYLDSLSRPSLFYVVTKYKSQLLFFCVCDLGKRKKKYSSAENTFNFNSNNLPKNMTFFQGSLGQHSYFFSAYLFTPVKQ